MTPVRGEATEERKDGGGVGGGNGRVGASDTSDGDVPFSLAMMRERRDEERRWMVGNARLPKSKIRPQGARFQGRLSAFATRCGEA